MEIKVDTDPERDDLPQGFLLGDRYIGVTDILDRWPGADHCYLKVHAGGGGLYLLRREDVTDRWQLWMYQAEQPSQVGPLSGS
ncbi:hypothetical protein [Thiohalorhabdus sp.]|uniref:hypothetical protein n=1 Tax=Thiohalorhabdus sp. TaxID=3094134 RepID=UPI002FC3B629